jgi:alpha-glucosidase (family GH31 glycosyl hydrolase)
MKRFLIEEPDTNRYNAFTVCKWWNGHSALLDLSNPECFAWVQHKLDSMIKDYGIDGFKFDAGDTFYYAGNRVTCKKQSPNAHTEDFARLGLKYNLSEYRACWKLGGKHLLQRVRDKADTWVEGGIADILPTALAQGLMGYPYTCPDMIGGGLGSSIKRPGDPSFDQELFVRWTQSAVFFPVMQFSQLPYRVLNKKNLKMCMDMVKLRTAFAPKMLALARHSSKTGEPMLRHMAYEFPDGGMEKIQGQFMFGGDYLIAPVLIKGATTKRIQFPKGTWKGDDGSIVKGPCSITVPAPISRLPYYQRA